MDLTNLKTRFKNDFLALGTFASGPSENKLESSILLTALVVWTAKPWPWKTVTATLNTTANTLGPYDPPSDFYTLADERRLSRWGALERQTLYAIKDTDEKSWDIYYNDVDNKLYFLNDPGSETLTIGYQAEFDNDADNLSTTLAVFPEEMYECFHHGVMAEILNNPGTLKESAFYEGKRDKAIERVWQDYSRNRSRQAERVPHGLNGQVYDNIARPRPLYPHTGAYVNKRSW